MLRYVTSTRRFALKRYIGLGTSGVNATRLLDWASFLPGIYVVQHIRSAATNSGDTCVYAVLIDSRDHRDRDLYPIERPKSKSYRAAS